MMRQNDPRAKALILGEKPRHHTPITQPATFRWHLHLPVQTFLLFFCALTNSSAQGLIVRPADIILVHGRVYTENAKQPWAQAVAILGSKIVAVGDDPEIEKMRGIGTKVINVGGKLVLPGFADCHVNFLEGSIELGWVHLDNEQNLADIRAKLRAYAAENPGDNWILGIGWNNRMFMPDKVPDRKDLDDLFPNRPVALEGFDRNTYWVNSKAMALAGITHDTPNPTNGTIARDPSTGEATGVLKGLAKNLVDHALPAMSRAEKLLALRAGMKWANQNGLTRAQAAGSDNLSGDFEVVDLYDEMHRRGDLTVRMQVAYSLEPPILRPKDLEAIEKATKKYRSDWLSTGIVKLRLDGAEESHVAAMLEPHSDDASLNGSLFWEPDQFKTAVAQLNDRDLQIFTEATGDYAVRTAVGAYENAQHRTHKHGNRLWIEHIETTPVTNTPRLGKLGVIATMLPLPSKLDVSTMEVGPHTIGGDRASSGWAWKSIADAGGHLAFGSDWPVVTLNPWEGIQTAVMGQTMEGKPEADSVREQRLTVVQAVEAYTSGAAFAGHHEKTEGSIEIGKLADLIIISQDIFNISPHKIAQTKVLTTIVGGRLVHQSNTK